MARSPPYGPGHALWQGPVRRATHGRTLSCAGAGPPMDVTTILEMLSYTVTIVGLPVAIVIFFYE